jgi:hypothetical protein
MTKISVKEKAKLTKFVRKVLGLLKLNDWTVEIDFQGLSGIKDFLGEIEFSPDTAAFGAVTWEPDKQSATIYMAYQDEFKKHDQDMYECLTHELVHIRISGHLSPEYSVHDERAAHAITSILYPVLKKAR